MINLTEAQIEKVQLWLRIKLVSLMIAFFLFALENVIGVRGLLDLIPGYAAVALAGANGLLVNELLKRNIRASALVVFSFLVDASVIILGIYFHGGLENPWAFAPMIATFMGAYVFGTAIGLVFASYSFFSLLLMFALEYGRTIPHFPVYSLPDLYWIDMRYFTDSLLGMFFLHFTVAVAVGSLSKLTDQRNEKIEEMAGKFRGFQDGVRSVGVEIERAKAMVNEKDADVVRQLKIIEDREREIAETRSEVERLGRGRSG